MLRFSFLISLVLAMLWPPAVQGQAITDQFRLQWQADLGLTTYRSQMAFDDANQILVIGSNGAQRDLLGDPQDGVYLLKARTGKVKRHLHQPGPIDGDVNGVALAGDWLYFGDDHGRVYGYRGGKRRWAYRIPVKDSLTQGDIERAPALADLTGDGVADVIVAAEEYGLLALDGLTGARLWEVSGQEGHGHGLGSPICLDVNQDGVPDVIWGSRTEDIYQAPNDRWGTYGDWIMALDGRDGSLLWRHPVSSAINASPLLYQADGQPQLVVAETYSELYWLDLQGKQQLGLTQPMPDGGISGFFASPCITAQHQLVIGTSWWGETDGVWVFDLEATEPQPDGMLALRPEARRFVQVGQVSATAVNGDLFDAPGQEAVVGTEAGELLVFSEAGDLLQRLQLPAGVEAPVLIGDFNGDGNQQLLVACLDGQVYCYTRK
jgi:outer membrane protein assembly factor BamB